MGDKLGAGWSYGQEPKLDELDDDAFAVVGCLVMVGIVAVLALMLTVGILIGLTILRSQS